MGLTSELACLDNEASSLIDWDQSLLGSSGPRTTPVPLLPGYIWDRKASPSVQVQSTSLPAHIYLGRIEIAWKKIRSVVLSQKPISRLLWFLLVPNIPAGPIYKPNLRHLKVCTFWLAGTLCCRTHQRYFPLSTALTKENRLSILCKCSRKSWCIFFVDHRIRSC